MQIKSNEEFSFFSFSFLVLEMLLRDIKPYIMFITHSLHVYFDHIQMLIGSYITVNKTEVHTL